VSRLVRGNFQSLCGACPALASGCLSGDWLSGDWFGFPWRPRARRPLSRLILLIWLCIVAAAPTTVMAEGDSSPLKPPNIIFIFSDDHALQAIGSYGSRINQTPRIDQIARQGMIFDLSFCGNSICGPSRATVLTGQHSHLNGFMRNGDRFNSQQPTVAKLLQQAGYQTAVIGKWHLETEPVGFDFWRILPDQGHYYNPDFIQMDGTRQRYEGYCTDLIGEMSIEWLRQRDPGKPFFLMSQHKAPHRNWSPAPRHFGRYKMGSIPEPETLFDDYSGRSELLKQSEMSLRDHFYWGHDLKFKGKNQFPDFFLEGINNGEYARMTAEQKEEWDAWYEPENEAFLRRLEAGELNVEQVTRWKYQRYLHDYLGCVEAVDENVGRMLDYLDETGLAENTIIIYCSDQGFYLGEHGWYDKRWMFEESLRMPFLIRWPGVVAEGVRSRALIQNIDYGPTFLEIAGLPVPPSMQGKSLLGILTNQGQPPEDWRDAVYYAFHENLGVHRVAAHDGVRTERYKAIYFSASDEWNLFDLELDPQEMTSRHEDPGYQEVLRDLQQRYRELKAGYRAHSAVQPESRLQENWWKERYQAKRKQAQDESFDLLLLGDSITQGWEGAGQQVFQKYFGNDRVLNFGFSGDRTEHLLWRLKNNGLVNRQPKAAVMMIGTNNTGHKMQSPQEVAEGIEETARTLGWLMPETKVLLLGVFPRGAEPTDPMRVNNRQINERIASLHDGQRVFYLNLDQQFLEEDGSLSPGVMPDYLHLSEEGYLRWAEGISPVLKDWLER
jgi:arylsulfatase A-like enzyme